MPETDEAPLIQTSKIPLLLPQARESFYDPDTHQIHTENPALITQKVLKLIYASKVRYQNELIDPQIRATSEVIIDEAKKYDSSSQWRKLNKPDRIQIHELTHYLNDNRWSGPKDKILLDSKALSHSEKLPALETVVHFIQGCGEAEAIIHEILGQQYLDPLTENYSHPHFLMRLCDLIGLYSPPWKSPPFIDLDKVTRYSHQLGTLLIIFPDQLTTDLKTMIGADGPRIILERIKQLAQDPDLAAHTVKSALPQIRQFSDQLTVKLTQQLATAQQTIPEFNQHHPILKAFITHSNPTNP